MLAPMGSSPGMTEMVEDIPEHGEDIPEHGSDTL
jgi:hypothetical protein